MPHSPLGITKAVVTLVDLGRAHASFGRHVAGAFSRDAFFSDFVHLEDHFRSEPGHIDVYLEPYDTSDRQIDLDLALIELPEFLLLGDPIVRMALQVKHEIVVALCKDPRHPLDIEAMVGLPPFTMQMQDLFSIMAGCCFCRSPLGFSHCPDPSK